MKSLLSFHEAYSIIGITEETLHFLIKIVFSPIYKSMVRSQLEYSNCTWLPHTVQDKKKCECPNKGDQVNTKTQASHIQIGYRFESSYIVTPLVKRDIIVVYKFLSGIFDRYIACQIG